MLHYCEYCEFKSKHKWVVKRHTEKKHKIYFNNNITNNESKLIQEAIKINGAPNHEPLHNIQYGSGSTVIPIEKYNQAVESSHLWKNNCEKLEEDNYVKDNAVKIRDAHLQNQNIKLQDEFNKNNNLHADYHDALKKIEQLELINKENCNESDDKIAAMGKDMGKVIRENKQLKRKNLVPRIQNSRFLLTSDHITTPKLYVSPIFFPNNPYFPSLHVTRIFSVKRPKIYFDLFHSSQVGPYLRTWVLKTDLLVILGPY